MAAKIDMFYGQSGTGKSEAAASVIEWVYETTGLGARVIVGDGSGATYRDRGLVDAGVAEIMDFSIRDWPTSTLAQLCEGYWPEDADDPKSPLVQPTHDTLKQIGVFVVEGLSVAGQYLMGDMKGGLAEQAARGIKIGQDSPVRLVDAEYDPKTGQYIKGTGTGMAFGGNPVAHYGFVQRRLLANVERTKVFPHMVIWTAHERSTQDKISGEKLVGPEAMGEAITANLSRHFNNTLHFVTAQRKKEKKKDAHTEQMITELDVEYRVYTRDHFHPDGSTFVKYKAVTRGVSESMGMPLYLQSDIPGEAVLEFYRKVEAIKAERLNKLKAKRGQVA